MLSTIILCSRKQLRKNSYLSLGKEFPRTSGQKKYIYQQKVNKSAELERKSLVVQIQLLVVICLERLDILNFFEKFNILLSRLPSLFSMVSSDSGCAHMVTVSEPILGRTGKPI